MVGMMVGNQHPRQCHAVSGEGVEQVTGGIGRVDHHRLGGFPVTDEVGEVAHLLCDGIAGGEVTAGEQLPEVETVIGCHGVNPRA